MLARRPARPQHDPWRAQGVLVEDEGAALGQRARVATMFLTGRECPWRCVMCDLWQHTTETDTPRGAIPAQITTLRQQLQASGEHVTHVKLYNAGSFFDPGAVPEADYDGIALALAGFSRVIVESHPSLIGARTQALLDALHRHAPPGTCPPALEVAIGLETVHPGALERLNKRMTVDSFRLAADRLGVLGVSLRVFLLVHPPFVPLAEQDTWLVRSVDAAFAAGATAVSLIPTRTGNGALDALAAAGAFRPTLLADLERSAGLALARAVGGGLVFADLWDLGRFSNCAGCLATRRRRLHTMNLEQRLPEPVECSRCAVVYSA